jgi:hypothetical protein
MAASTASTTFYRRYGAAILVLAAALGPLIAWGVLVAIRSNSNDVRDWLPAQYTPSAMRAIENLNSRWDRIVPQGEEL